MTYRFRAGDLRTAEKSPSDGPVRLACGLHSGAVLGLALTFGEHAGVAQLAEQLFCKGVAASEIEIGPKGPCDHLYENNQHRFCGDASEAYYEPPMKAIRSGIPVHRSKRPALS
jgi:hypothetical protein